MTRSHGSGFSGSFLGFEWWFSISSGTVVLFPSDTKSHAPVGAPATLGFATTVATGKALPADRGRQEIANDPPHFLYQETEERDRTYLPSFFIRQLFLPNVFHDMVLPIQPILIGEQFLLDIDELSRMTMIHLNEIICGLEKE